MHTSFLRLQKYTEAHIVTITHYVGAFLSSKLLTERVIRLSNRDTHYSFQEIPSTPEHTCRNLALESSSPQQEANRTKDAKTVDGLEIR